MNDQKQTELAMAVHRCEPGSLERLIDAFEPPLYRYARGMLQNTADAQDVVQEAMIRAHRALTRQYDTARVAALALQPWLFRTVRNLCLNWQRSRRRSAEQPLEIAANDTFVTPNQPELEARQDAERLHQALALLPWDAREVVVLRFIEELSYAEMAGLLGATESSLRGKVFRSLKLLRTALEKRGVNHAL